MCCWVTLAGNMPSALGWGHSSLSTIERPGLLEQSDIGGHFLSAYPGCQSLAQFDGAWCFWFWKNKWDVPGSISGLQQEVWNSWQGKKMCMKNSTALGPLHKGPSKTATVSCISSDIKSAALISVAAKSLILCLKWRDKG